MLTPLETIDKQHTVTFYCKRKRKNMTAVLKRYFFFVILSDSRRSIDQTIIEKIFLRTGKSFQFNVFNIDRKNVVILWLIYK